MYVRIKLGHLVDNLSKAISISRKRMEYASNVEKSGWFSKEVCSPIESDLEYWFEYMSSFNPWIELRGIFTTSLIIDKDEYVFVKGEVIAKIAILLKEADYGTTHPKP